MKSVWERFAALVKALGREPAESTKGRLAEAARKCSEHSGPAPAEFLRAQAAMGHYETLAAIGTLGFSAPQALAIESGRARARRSAGAMALLKKFSPRQIEPAMACGEAAAAAASLGPIDLAKGASSREPFHKPVDISAFTQQGG